MPLVPDLGWDETRGKGGGVPVTSLSDPEPICPGQGDVVGGGALVGAVQRWAVGAG